MRAVSRRIIHLHGGDFWKIVEQVLGRRVTGGSCIEEFEQVFADFVGTRHAVSVATGRLGLRLVLNSYKFPEGSEVLLPAYEDLSVPRVIADCGLKPVCVDIDPCTHTIAPEAISERLTDRTVAVVAAHLFGIPCDMDGIRQVLAGRDIALIEDCAHAVGSTIGERHVGTFGDAAFFSFHTTKPFMTFGGCMVTTDDHRIAEEVRKNVQSLPYPSTVSLLKRIVSAYVMHLITHRRLFPLILYPMLRILDRFDVDPVSVYNRTMRPSVKIRHTAARFTNLQSCVGLKHLERAIEYRDQRRRNAAILHQALKGVTDTLAYSEGYNGYFYIALTDRLPQVRRRLLRFGVDTGYGLMRDCSGETGDTGGWPHTADALSKSLQIPIYETLTERDVRRIARRVAAVLSLS